MVVDVVAFEVPVSDESVGDGELGVDNVGEPYEEKEEEGCFFHGTKVVRAIQSAKDRKIEGKNKKSVSNPVFKTLFLRNGDR